MPYDVRAHQAVIALRDYLDKMLGRTPTIAVLATVNTIVGRISETISTGSVTVNGVLPAVDHELQWDPELSAAAGYVVASILEWPSQLPTEAVSSTLRAIANFYRVKLSGGTTGARAKIRTIERAVTAFQRNDTVRAKTAVILIQAYDTGIEFSGQPVSDWQTARSCLSGSAELEELFKQARLLRLFKATDALAWALIDAWDGRAAYADAAGTVRRVLGTESLTAAQQAPASVSLMSMHRSKGKEFDGVIIVEGAFNGRLLDTNWNAERIQANRRLLRVAITRARHMAVFVRPEGAPSLVDD